VKEGVYLVTGASGFIGSNVVRLLVDRGVRVRAMVRDPRKSADLEKLGVPVVIADLRDASSLSRAVEGARGVFHIASLFRRAGLPESVFHDVNAEGVRRLFDAAIGAGVERLVHCSTVGVLGHIENPPATEDSPYNPGDMYQRSKLSGEKIALEYLRSGRMKGVVIRPTMVYGPGDTRNLKMFRMVARRCWFYVGDGETKVHFVDVRELARAFLLAMEKEERNGEVYLVVGPKAVSQKVMADRIASELGVPRPWLHLPVKPMQWLGSLCEAICMPLKIPPPIYRRRVDFFTKHREFSGEKAARDLGFRPAKTFEEEIVEITRWYREHGWI